MSNEDFMQICGAISGAITDIFCDRARDHAYRYYAAIRKRMDDIPRIAANTEFDIAQITAVKNYIFMEKQDLGEGLIDFFAPSFSMAQSWQRLIEGKNILPHDITLIKHELMEMELVKQGYSQNDAHTITSAKYNYKKESEDYYVKIKEHQNGKQYN